MGAKITNEAPVGIKAGLRASYQWVTQELLDAVNRWERGGGGQGLEAAGPEGMGVRGQGERVGGGGVVSCRGEPGLRQKKSALCMLIAMRSSTASLPDWPLRLPNLALRTASLQV